MEDRPGTWGNREMEIRPEVVVELRTLLKEGATPSRLIRHIAERHPVTAGRHLLIQLYFQEAFHVPIVRGLNSIDDYRHDDLRHGFLNDQIIPQMIEHRTEWLTNEEAAGTWLENLKSRDSREHIELIQRAPDNELRGVWDKLSEREQRSIEVSMASANRLYEQVQILAKFAERLQQRINHLESQSTTIEGDVLVSEEQAGVLTRMRGASASKS